MRRALTIWAILFAAYAATLGLASTPDGGRVSPREGHVLLTAESIVSDRDMDLRDEYLDGAWSKFDGPALRPNAGLVNGRLVEVQGLGFPLLVAPAYAIGGRTAVELFLAALMALGFVLAAALGRRLVPDPWPSTAALVAGLSPPVLAASTTVSPEGAGATALALAALGALSVREVPRFRAAVPAAAAIGLAPWLAVSLVPAAVVCAFALARWMRRRQRGFAGFVALEVVFLSAVLYVTFNDRLFGGFTPYSSAPNASPTGLGDAGELADRLPRLVGVWLDQEAGLLRWAPFAAMAFVALWLLWRSVRDRLAVAVADQVHVEVAAGFLALVCAAQVVTAALLAPGLHGAWSPARLLVPAIPVATALAAWGLRFAPRAGGALAALTLAGSAWMLIGLRLGSGSLAPAGGDVPWGGAEDLLPRFAAPLDGGEAAVIAAVIAGVVALVVRERREWLVAREPPVLSRERRF